MQSITSVSIFPEEEGVILVGTKKGVFGNITFNILEEKYAKQEWFHLENFEDEIIDIQPHMNDSLILTTAKKVFLINYERQKNKTLQIRDKRVLYSTDNNIIQIDVTETKLLVTTFRSYFIVSIFGQECVQVGTKEKQGIFGSVFYNDGISNQAQSQE